MEELRKRAAEIKEAADFKEWKATDLSEIFWDCLGRYVKEPSRKDWELMNRAYYWAIHANHGLANSFSHAWKWAGIDYVTEHLKYMHFTGKEE